MDEDPRRIVISGLTKTFGSVRAVDDLSFTVEPGTVTGFLGPNGAGKTTTLRMLLGLVRPDSGRAAIGGRSYVSLPVPADEVGASLDDSGFHPLRTGRSHLRIQCTASGYPHDRADELLAMVGLAEAGSRRVGTYSLGMRQRLSLATALLGDPGVLVLDEPANGLDPEGIVWMRGLLRKRAEQGGTMLVSSHVLPEMEQLADRVVIISQGRLVRQGTLAELSGSSDVSVHVRTPRAEELCAVLRRAAADGVRIERSGADGLRVTGLDPAAVGRCASAEQIEVHELTVERGDLERLFLELTSEGRAEPAGSQQG